MSSYERILDAIHWALGILQCWNVGPVVQECTVLRESWIQKGCFKIKLLRGEIRHGEAPVTYSKGKL